ncbi:MAG: DOPA 4,5-dioxygenase family protein [Alphaproteobacteria bacterium]|nr:DOPA 4,5-dioxygenase family protein [Alphaproteobacteria bacterium]
MTDAAAADTALITAYHAHIYYDAATRPQAERLRAQLGAVFPDARLGRWHDAPIGPHPQGMFQVAFAPVLFATLTPWLMLNRAGLTVLLHPETGHERADHTVHAAWMGAILPLDLSMLAD